jgi:S-adenosylmethionine:tRNA ribosyltransferase-isomerase
LKPLYIQDYAYDLPDERIAKFPVSPRDTSKLLVYNKNQIGEDVFSNLADHLPSGAMLVFNNTKVIPARLLFHNRNGAGIEIFCLNPYQPTSYEQSLQSFTSCVWTCLVGNQKRWKDEELCCSFTIDGVNNTLIVNKLCKNGADVQVEFRWTAKDCTFAQVLERCGTIPLPPYLHRDAQPADYKTYQTIYARHNGSVAAPTAGLHFTERVFNSLKTNNIQTEEVTLHVGAGTFLPVKTATANEHTMHAERFIVRLALLEKLRANLGKIFAVGTTSTRTLESLHWIGCNLLIYNELRPSLSQWDAYQLDNEIGVEKSLEALINYLKINNLQQFEAATSLMIAPSYRYKVVSGLVTNFHQPQSTLLLLVSAMVGNDWHAIYDYALQHNFRFLSYGDSSLIFGQN